MEDKLNLFYNTLTANPNIKGLPSDYETFSSTLQDPAKAELFYNSLRANPNIKGLPDSYDAFTAGLALKAGGVEATEDLAPQTEAPELVSTGKEPLQRPGEFVKGLGEKLGSSVMSLGEMVTEIPQAFEAAANAPGVIATEVMTRKALKRGEIDQETADYLIKEAESIAPMRGLGQTLPSFDVETIGDKIADSKVNEWFDENAEKLSEAGAHYDKSAIDYIKSGQIRKALGAISYGVTESLAPTLAAAFVPGGVAFLGVGVGAQQYDEVKDREDMTEAMKLADAVTVGMFEWVFERFGTKAMSDYLRKIYKAKGGVGIEQAFKSQGMQSLIAKAYKKFGVWFAPIHEGLSEVLTTFGQNAAAKFSGEDPERKITDGAWDSFLVGAGMGSGFALVEKAAELNRKLRQGGGDGTGPVTGPLSMPQSPEATIRQEGQKYVWKGGDINAPETNHVKFGLLKDGRKVVLTNTNEYKDADDMVLTAYDASDPAGKPFMVKGTDVMESKDVPFDEWVAGEVKQYQATTEQIGKQVATSQSPYQPGQTIEYQGKKWGVADVNSDGSLTVDEITEEGLGASAQITPDQFNNIIGNQPQATGQPQPTDQVVGPLSVPQGAAQQPQAAETPQKPQARKISDGKNDLSITPQEDGNFIVDQVFNTQKSVELTQKKLQELYPKVKFEVVMQDSGDPFTPDEYRIHAIVQKKAAPAAPAPKQVQPTASVVKPPASEIKPVKQGTTTPVEPAGASQTRSPEHLARVLSKLNEDKLILEEVSTYGDTFGDALVAIVEKQQEILAAGLERLKSNANERGVKPIDIQEEADTYPEYIESKRLDGIIRYINDSNGTETLGRSVSEAIADVNKEIEIAPTKKIRQVKAEAPEPPASAEAPQAEAPTEVAPGSKEDIIQSAKKINAERRNLDSDSPEYAEANDKLAKLFGFKDSEDARIVNGKWNLEREAIAFKPDKKGWATLNSIAVSQSPNGFWFGTYGYTLGNQGGGSYPSIYDTPFATREEALANAIVRFIDNIVLAAKGESKAAMAYAKKLLAEANNELVKLGYEPVDMEKVKIDETAGTEDEEETDDIEEEEPVKKAEKPSKAKKQPEPKEDTRPIQKIQQKKGWPMSKEDEAMLAKEPQSFEEAVLQFLLGGGRISMEDYYTHFGRNNSERLKNIWMYSKEGIKLDKLNELYVFQQHPNFLVGMEGAMDQPNAFADILRSLSGKNDTRTKLRAIQEKTDAATKDVPPTEEDMRSDLINMADETVPDAIEDPAIMSIFEHELNELGNTIEFMREKAESDPAYFQQFPYGLYDNQFNELKNILNDTARTSKIQGWLNSHRQDQGRSEGNGAVSGVDGAESRDTGTQTEEGGIPEGRDTGEPTQSERERAAIEQWLPGSEYNDYISFDWDGESLDIFTGRDDRVIGLSRQQLIDKGVFDQEAPAAEVTPEPVPQEEAPKPPLPVNIQFFPNSVLKGKSVTIETTNAETGAKERVTTDALALQRELRKRDALLKKLKDCVG